MGQSGLARGTQGVTQGKKKGRNGVEVFLADASNEAGPRGSWTRERMGKTGTSEMEEMSEVEEIDREKKKKRRLRQKRQEKQD